MKKIKKTIYIDIEQWEKLSQRTNRYGTTPSARIRELIYKDNLEYEIDKKIKIKNYDDVEYKTLGK